MVVLGGGDEAQTLHLKAGDFGKNGSNLPELSNQGWWLPVVPIP